MITKQHVDHWPGGTKYVRQFTWGSEALDAKYVRILLGFGLSKCKICPCLPAGLVWGYSGVLVGEGEEGMVGGSIGAKRL